MALNLRLHQQIIIIDNPSAAAAEKGRHA